MHVEFDFTREESANVTEPKYLGKQKKDIWKIKNVSMKTKIRNLKNLRPTTLFKKDSATAVLL